MKSIELTVDNQIWEWYEKEYFDNQIIYLAKNEHGEVIHKTIEDLNSGQQERFGSNGKLYTKIIKAFDSKGRVIKSKHLDERGKVKEEHRFKFIDGLEIWEYFERGKLIKRENRQKDEQQRITFYLREDESGKSLEWVKWEYDKFGNAITIENGIERNKPTNKTKIVIEYLKKENGS